MNITVLLKPVNKNITLITLDMVVIPSSHRTEISSFRKDFSSKPKRETMDRGLSSTID
jgi:hypothetical protein